MKKELKDSAFPHEYDDGMTLRDYFAAKAIDAAYMNVQYKSVEQMARVAYEMADAMLEARNQENK